MIIPEGTRFAAIDIGSNSMRLELARYEMGQLVYAGYHKESVSLGAGLLADGNLSQEAMNRGFDCLKRFAQHLQGMQESCVLAVATQTLREATNRGAFFEEASKILGYFVTTISGREEARLIYNGVTRLLPQSDERRLVVDIGGRSTEVIVGQGFNAERSESVVIGSVNLSLAHFYEGKYSAKLFRRAISHAVSILENALIVTQDFKWEQAYGASGTIGAVADVLIASNISDGTITRANCHKLLDVLLKAGNVDKLRLPGLKEDRRAVIAGGLCSLIAVFEVFNIRRLKPTKGALRHGLLYDLIAIKNAHYPFTHSPIIDNNINIRAQTVRRLQHKFRVDVEQAKRVHDLVLMWVDELGLARATIGYAAELHEIGIIVSHVEYHKHGAYLIDRCDVLGFSSGELKKMTALILGQRGGLRKMEKHWHDKNFMRKILILRLAVIFCHGRKKPPQSPLRFQPFKNNDGYTLQLEGDWQSTMPQTLYLLQEEVTYWKKTPFKIVLVKTNTSLE